MKLDTLSNYKTMIELAVNQGYVHEDELQTLKEWRRDRRTGKNKRHENGEIRKQTRPDPAAGFDDLQRPVALRQPHAGTGRQSGRLDGGGEYLLVQGEGVSRQPADRRERAAPSWSK